MKTAAEYRAMADECFEWAREARTAEVAHPTCGSRKSGSMLPLNSTAFHRPRHRQPQARELKTTRSAGECWPQVGCDKAVAADQDNGHHADTPESEKAQTCKRHPLRITVRVGRLRSVENTATRKPTQ
jgi:hypothetical protein